MSTLPQALSNASGELRSESSGVRDQQVTTGFRKKEQPADPNDEILKDAREFFRSVTSYESEWRKRSDEEIRFCDFLEHWDQASRDERRGRPCLTFDRIGPSVDQVINDARQSPPEPRISPVGGGADKKTAEVLQGLIRNIENDSRADQAYLTAYEHAVKVGRGWWRILTEYESEDSFAQKLVIKRVSNLFSVYPDPAAAEHDYSDGRRLIATETLAKELFKELYPNAKTASLDNFDAIGDVRQREEWFPNGAVRLAEYWWVEEDVETIYLLSSGKVVTKKELYDAVPVDNRQRNTRHVYGAKLTGIEVLEKWEWLGRWIPFVPVIGRDSVREGKRMLRGMIRPAMDANLQYDYMRSKQAEAIALAPISQWLVAEGQLENHESTWADSNRKSVAWLPYKQVDSEGRPAPPPERVDAEPAVQAITEAIAAADNDIKATLQTYDASLGAPGPEQSGKAILARQREGDNAHFHYVEGLAWAMRFTGLILLDLIPKYYDEPRTISITDPDGSTKAVGINQLTVYDGIEQIFKLGDATARYHVTVSSGPSFPARRQEGAQALMQLTQTIPGPMSRALDLVIRALDIPDAEELADRLRPPDIQATQDGEPSVSALKMQLGQAQQIIQLLNQKLNELGDKQQIEREKMATQERIAYHGDQTTLAAAALKAGVETSIVELQQTIQSLNDRIAQLASVDEANAQRAHDAQQAQADRQHQADQSQADRVHQMAMQQNAQEAQPEAQAA